MPVIQTTIGTVQPYSAVAIKSQVDGQITQVHFKEGQVVKKGDLLFTLDKRPFQAALSQAEATLAKDRALLAKAKGDLTRYSTLVEKDFASRARFEEAQAAAASLEATIRGDEAQVELMRLRLEYAEIRAPIDGRVGSILINTGNLVKANDVGALVLINQTQPIYAQFSLPESHLAEIKRRMAEGTIKVKATIPEDGLPPSEGVLTFVNNAVDSTTGTIMLKATYSNDDHRLTPGQFVSVAVELSVISQAVVIPTAAIQSGQRGQFVFVVKADDSVEVRLVKTSIMTDRDVVVSSGLAAGERVVIEGQLRLRPGARVTVRPPSPPARPTGSNPPG